jgi:hypothetical protein
MLLPFIILSCSNNNKPSVPDILSEDTPIYHITGYKDKRLEAVYSVSFKSSLLQNDKCRQANIITGKNDKPVIMSKSYIVKGEDYTVDIPIEFTDNTNGCGFELIGVDLTIRRVNDPDWYSKLYILMDRHYNDLNSYSVFRSSIGSKWDKAPNNRYETPWKLKTDKKHFTIAPDTSFLCRTNLVNFTTREGYLFNHDEFYCVMKINSGDTNIYYPDETSMARNPQFGVDEIVNSNFTINIIADDNGSTAHLDGEKGGKQPYKFLDYDPKKKNIEKDVEASMKWDENLNKNTTKDK